MIRYKIDTQERLVRTEMSGHNTYADFVAYLADILTDEAYDANYNTLFRVTPGASGSIAGCEPNFKDLLEKLETDRKGVRWAVVVPNHTYLSWIRLMLDNVVLDSIELRLFIDEDDALHWLCDHRPDHPMEAERLRRCATRFELSAIIGTLPDPPCWSL